jgi:DNA mismatch endonuclease (patch repair protein)
VARGETPVAGEETVTLLDVGDEIEHAMFGSGFVTGVTGGEHPKFSVVFGKDLDLVWAMPQLTLPTPPASSEAVRRRMSSQKRAGTDVEMTLRRALFAHGLRYRVQYRPECLKGTRRSVDIAFPSWKVAVFVDGCYWHGCPTHFRSPKSNTGWWEAKVMANKARDADTDARLEADGWEVLRFWEHRIDSSLGDVVELVREHVS